MKNRNLFRLVTTVLLALTHVVQPIFAEAPAAADFTGVQLVAENRDVGFIIKADGSLWSWGEAYFSGVEPADRPVKLREGENGAAYTEAGFSTEEKASETTDIFLPLKTMDAVASVSVGHNHVLAVKKDGSLWAWGEGQQGQLGNGTAGSGAHTQTPIKIMDHVASAVASYTVSFAVKTDGSLWYWGQGAALTESGAEIHVLPKKIADEVASIAAGPAGGFLMILKKDHSLWTMGAITGDGTRNRATTPVKIMEDVASLFAPGPYSPRMVIKKDGSLWAWGENGKGQLGNGMKAPLAGNEVLSPVKVLDHVADIRTGSSHTLALKKDGSLWAWGSNDYGYLGNGTAKDSAVPLKVMDHVVSIANAGSFSLALKADGGLWAWGYNAFGDLGDGTKEHKLSPVKILEDVILMASGDSISCAVKKDGSLWAWGSEGPGYGGNSESLVPVKIMDCVLQ